MATKEKMVERLKEELINYSKEDVDSIMEAVEYAARYHGKQKRASGEDFIIHPLAVAIILAEMNVEKNMIIAGILHDVVEDTEATLDDVKKAFGENVGRMVDGVTKISKLKPARHSKTETDAETIRKMLFAMINDMKVIVIKLADKIHNMSTLNFLPAEKRKRIAFETLEIYAPLAGKIGMHYVKDRLEDLSLKWLNPEVYETIQDYFNRTEKDREKTVKIMTRVIEEKIKDADIPFKIKSRAKHYYSIYRKMKKFNKRIEEIFDLNGIRIITNSVANCYQIFGVIHNIWQPIPGRFRDFIANPKKNGYRSLHTTVIFERRKAVEIQIRTEEMDEFNEYGVASHWFYKKGETPSVDQLKWLKKLKEVHRQKLSPEEYYNTLRDDILKDEIYVFTPKGDIIELPKGATALDFAYKIHTEVGHKCKGAKANGVIYPLHQPLKNGMVVEIILNKENNPKKTWLSIVKTSHARKKIKSFFADLKETDDHEEKQSEQKVKTKRPANLGKNIQVEQKDKIINNSRTKITIDINGEKNFLFNIAKCCNAYPPDPIVGFVSRGRGIIIHRKDCNNIKYIKDFEKRMIEANWNIEK